MDKVAEMEKEARERAVVVGFADKEEVVKEAGKRVAVNWVGKTMVLKVRD